MWDFAQNVWSVILILFYFTLSKQLDSLCNWQGCKAFVGASLRRDASRPPHLTGTQHLTLVVWDSILILKYLNASLLESTATVLKLSGFKLKFPVGLQPAYGANKSPVALNKC